MASRKDGQQKRWASSGRQLPHRDAFPIHAVAPIVKRLSIGIEPAAGGHGLTGDEALNAAFEANARDVARIGGG